jgi:hypothetical protein
MEFQVAILISNSYSNSELFWQADGGASRIPSLSLHYLSTATVKLGAEAPLALSAVAICRGPIKSVSVFN